MVGWDLEVRDIENLCQDLKENPEVVKGVKSKREVVNLNMNLKMRDEKKHQRKLKRRRDYCKMQLENKYTSKKEFTKLISMKIMSVNSGEKQRN